MVEFESTDCSIGAASAEEVATIMEIVSAVSEAAGGTTREVSSEESTEAVADG
jgi:hypothetical protein